MGDFRPGGDESDRGVDDVSRSRLPAQFARCQGDIVERGWFQVRHRASESGLTRTTAPRLRERTDWNDDGYVSLEGFLEAEPHRPVVTLQGEERTGVENDHAVLFGRRFVIPSSVRTAATSASVNSPCSDSHSAMSPRTRSLRSRWRAASASQAENDTPALAAAASIWSRSSGSREILGLAAGMQPRYHRRWYRCFRFIGR